MRHLDIQSLRYFIKAAEYLNFTKAAQEFYIAQPAMSQQIIKIEKELGFKLFDRSNKNLSLTLVGSVFLEEAISIVEKYDQAFIKCKIVDEGYVGKLDVAFNSQYVRSYLPNIIHRFNEKYSKIKLNIRASTSTYSSPELEQGLADIYFTHNHDLEKKYNYVTETLCKNYMIFAINANHPFASREVIYPFDLIDETLIILSEKTMPTNYNRILMALASNGYHPKKIEQAIDFDTMMLMVEAGLGYAIVPSNVKSLQPKLIKYYPIEDIGDQFIHEISAVYLKSNNNKFIDYFIATCKEFLSSADYCT